MAAKPSDAEFAQWLRPGDALKRLPADWDEGTKRKAIIRAIRDDAIRALARRLTVSEQSGVRRGEKEPIDRRLWSDPWVNEDRDFWTAGDIEFWVPRPTEILFHAGLDRQPEEDGPVATVTLTDVRIEPASFAREFAAFLPAADRLPVAPTGNAEALSAEEFAGWLTPKAALAAVPRDVDENQRRDWITRRLREGQIVAAAEKATVTDMNGTNEASYAIIGRHFWSWRELGDWFASGDLDVTNAPEVVSAGPRLSLTAWRYDPDEIKVTRFSAAMFLGVRLNPAGFPRPKASANPGAPTPAEFEGWLRPNEVLDYYVSQGDRDPQAHAIQMLRDGFLQAAAGQLVINGTDLGLALIGRELWDLIGKSDVWSTGRFHYSAGDQSLSGYDVRVDREIRKLPAPRARKKSGPTKPPATKPLSDGRLAEWAKLFFAAQPDATEKEARASLAAMFPDNSVSRERVRAVMPPRRRGRPLKAKQEN